MKLAALVELGSRRHLGNLGVLGEAWYLGVRGLAWALETGAWVLALGR